MKTILHPDYWVEIPAGEFLTGLSEKQRLLIRNRIREEVGYGQLPPIEHQLLENLVTKIRDQAEQAHHVNQPISRLPLELNKEEQNIQKLAPYRRVIKIEELLSSIPPQRPIWLDRFYIAIFPITDSQLSEFRSGKSAKNLSGTIERPHQGGAVIQMAEALRLCQDLGGRLPTQLEWEKAAQGTDGRLYPWGDDWVPQAGYFFRGQSVPTGGWVAGMSRGVSPYGVWGMAGGLPELVLTTTIEPYVTIKGCHPKESSAATAWFDHILIWSGTGMWVSCRPVLDKWPVQQWRG